MFGSQSIDQIFAFVKSYETSLRFYKELLRLPVAWEDAENLNAGLLLGAQLLVLQEGAGGAADGGFYLNFTVQDIWNVQEELMEAGVPCTPVQDAGDFQWVTFNDPDGNRLGLVEPTAEYQARLDGYLGRRPGQG